MITIDDTHAEEEMHQSQRTGVFLYARHYMTADRAEKLEGAEIAIIINIIHLMEYPKNIS